MWAFWFGFGFGVLVCVAFWVCWFCLFVDGVLVLLLRWLCNCVLVAAQLAGILFVWRLLMGLCCRLDGCVFVCLLLCVAGCEFVCVVFLGVCWWCACVVA